MRPNSSVWNQDFFSLRLIWFKFVFRRICVWFGRIEFLRRIEIKWFWIKFVLVSYGRIEIKSFHSKQEGNQVHTLFLSYQVAWKEAGVSAFPSSSGRIKTNIMGAPIPIVPRGAAFEWRSFEWNCIDLVGGSNDILNSMRLNSSLWNQTFFRFVSWRI